MMIKLKLEGIDGEEIFVATKYISVKRRFKIFKFESCSVTTDAETIKVANNYDEIIAMIENQTQEKNEVL